MDSSVPVEHSQTQGNARTIRTIIADDEELARKKLALMLDHIQNFEVISGCASGRETIAAVRGLKPDLLLLDIQMPDMNGFEILNALGSESAFVTVFTTAYDQYAVQAFEANALDYLLKPFDETRLRRTLDKVRHEIEKEQARVLATKMVSLFSDTKIATESNTERLVIRSEGRIVFLDLNDVDWIEAAANYVRFHVGVESYVFRASIGVLSKRLNEGRFVRIHRSVIVNTDKIKELQPCNASEYIVVLKNGKELSCSRGYRGRLQQLINNL